MPKYSQFAHAAHDLCKALHGHSSYGIAMKKTEMKNVFDTCHRTHLTKMFPSCKQAIRPDHYMMAVMRVTNDELEHLFQTMYEHDIGVLSSIKKPIKTVGKVIRVPTSPRVIGYDSIQYMTAMKPREVLQQLHYYIGHGCASYGMDGKLKWHASSSQKRTVPLTAKFDEVEESCTWVQNLGLAVEKEYSEHGFKNRKINFVGANDLIYQCGRSSFSIPGPLYDVFAQIHFRLKEASTYVFSLEQAESCVVPNLLANMERMSREGIQPDYEIHEILGTYSSNLMDSATSFKLVYADTFTGSRIFV